MKNILYIIGFGTLATSLYFYVKKQLDLALSYDYQVKSWKILNFTKDGLNADIVITLVNKSAFQIEVLAYDLSIFYQNINIARAFSTDNSIIQPNSSTDVMTTAEIDFSSVKDALLPFVTNVLKKNPIDISLEGFVKVKFMGFNHTVKFNKEKYQYSQDVLKDYGLDDDLEKIKKAFKF